MHEQPNYYSITPANVRYDHELRPNEKLLYGEITALANRNGYCWAENKYFAELYGVNKKTVSTWISNLEKKGYIQTKLTYQGKSKQVSKRYIYIANTLPTKKETPYPQKNGYPLHEKTEEELNNTRTNNTSINKDIVGKPDPLPYKEIIDYLNKQTGSNYKHTTKATRELINARSKEGFTLDDFKKVIDNKTSEWLNNIDFAKYLRPQTLFNTKFESYLNQPTNGPGPGGGGYDKSEYDDLF